MNPLSRYRRAVMRRLRSRFILFGTLRNVEPVNLAFGFGKGTPVDRYYIDRFLEQNAAVVTGRVLEVGDREYTRRFGQGVSRSDVLHAAPGSSEATIVADLADCPQIPDEAYDCIILTQTLHYIFDMKAAVSELRRILAPGGTVLCTVPGLSQISRYDMDMWGDRWRLTSLGASELFRTAFAEDAVEVRAYGNALSALCFIEGITAERIRTAELDARHEDYEIVVAIVASRRD